MKLGSFIPGLCAAAGALVVAFVLDYWLRVMKKVQSTAASSTNLVKASTAYVMHHAKHVSINKHAVQELVARLDETTLRQMLAPSAFDKSLHFVDDSWRTAQYLLVVDALNFCFWPAAGMEYEHLSTSLKALINKHGDSVIKAERLAMITAPELRDFFGWSRDLPQEEERVRLVQEVGQVLVLYFGGKVSNLIAIAQQSAQELVRLVTAFFPGFRDHAVYEGRQIFFLKRAQIFAADLYGAFGGKGLGFFRDIQELTMFADYRVPVVLRNQHILQYSADLQEAVDNRREIASGSPQEVEIRAATIQAVEAIRDGIRNKFGSKMTPLAIQLDWYLWDLGERNRASDPPHHRTRTIYY